MGTPVTCHCGEQYLLDAEQSNESSCFRCGRPLILSSSVPTESKPADIQELVPEWAEHSDSPNREHVDNLKRMFCPRCDTWVKGHARPVMHPLHFMLSVFLCTPWFVVWFLLSRFPARNCIQCGNRTYVGSGPIARLATLPKLLAGGLVCIALIMSSFVIPALRADRHFELGYELMQASQHEEAIAEFTKVIELQPDNFAAYYNRGIIHHFLADLPSAKKDLNAALRLSPNEVDALVQRGQVHLALGNQALAVADLDRAIELDPTNADVYFQRGYLRQESENWQQATSDYDQAIALNSKHVDAYYRRGYCQWQAGDYQRAIADFDATIAMDPKHSDAFHHRGHAWDDLKDFNRALLDYAVAIELSGDDPRNYACRASCYFNHGEFAKSIDDFDQAILRNGKEADYYYWRGQAFLRLRDLERARADFQQACELTQGANEVYSEALRAVQAELQERQQPPDPAVTATVSSYFRAITSNR